ncbi:MAG: hypothetical protein ACLRZ2_01710 [Veillonella sp.]
MAVARVSLHLAYFQGKPFFKQLYVLGMQKIGCEEYDEWIQQRVDDEYQKAVDEFENDPMAAQAEAMMKAMQGGGRAVLNRLSDDRWCFW